MQRKPSQLVDAFAGWLVDHGEPGAEADDLGLLLEWKQHHGTGPMLRWRRDDVEEFLLDFCPRHLSMTGADAARIPASVAAAVEFLAGRGLDGGSDEPGQLVRQVWSCAAEFAERMADPTYFGPAKSLVASVGGLDPDFDPTAPGALDELIARLGGELPDGVDGAGPGDLTVSGQHAAALTVGPVRMPDTGQRKASAAAAPVLVRFGQLHDAAGGDGLKLTAEGNLNMAAARTLVDLLETGDVVDPVIGDRQFRTPSSVELIGVTRWVDWAVTARVVRRYRGRLVAVAGWTKVATDPVAALDRAVDSLREIGPVSHDVHWDVQVPLARFVEDGIGRVLGELLDAGGDALDIDDVAGMISATVEVANQVMRLMPDLPGAITITETVPKLVRDLLDRFAECGVVQLDGVGTEVDEFGFERPVGGTAALTPAGVPVAARLAEELGMHVVERPDPATATAAQLVDQIGVVDEQAWLADVAVWSGERTATSATSATSTATVAELVAELAGPARDDPTVLSGLEMLHGAFGPACVPAVRTLLDGPRDAIAVLWLGQHDELDPSTVSQERLLASGVVVLAAVLDMEGPDGLLESLGHGQPREVVLDTVGRMWRSNHPRTGEVLTAVGQVHPDKEIAKAARKSAFKHRSRPS